MDQQYIRRLENIEAVLERWLPENPGAALAEDIFPGLGKKLNAESLQALTAPGRDLLSRGGKRWRPLLMTLVCESLGGGEAALPLAPLVEFCHNASLIHDDIEDDSDERRGRPAVHLVHGLDAAINGGCFLYFLPLSCIDPWALGLEARGLSSPLEYKNRVYSLWAGYMRKLHLGQAMDINWHRNFSLVPGVEEYYTMCGLKTGCLARFAAALGVCAGEAALTAGERAGGREVYAAIAELLGEAAEKLGVGFQILDDVKNLTTGIPGKKRGDDVVEGKKSLPVLLYLHRYPEKRELVGRCFAAARSGGAAAPEVEELIRVFEAAGVLAEAEEKGRSLIAEARQGFSSPLPGADFPLCGEGRSLLAGLTGLIS
ncbi:MAG: polyprenyl synthetase family protein [Treponema sp.]|jgi:octaprenyl-diphosphate synthase|nr:polyprenyl synthetase family protein [Treponema sp.]